MRIYIAGPMTNYPDHNFPAFEAAAKRLRDEGHFVINPAELSAMFGSPKEIEESFTLKYGCISGDPSEYIQLLTKEAFEPLPLDGTKHPLLAACVIDADLAAVRSCDAIFLLKGWEKSRGAKKELAEAITHGLTIMLEEAE